MAARPKIQIKSMQSCSSSIAGLAAAAAGAKARADPFRISMAGRHRIAKFVSFIPEPFHRSLVDELVNAWFAGHRAFLLLLVHPLCFHLSIGWYIGHCYIHGAQVCYLVTNLLMGHWFIYYSNIGSLVAGHWFTHWLLIYSLVID